MSIVWQATSIIVWCILVVSLSGLIFRGEWRHHKCLTLYVASLLIANSVHQLFPDLQSSEIFWYSKQALYAALHLAVLAETALRIGSATPRLRVLTEGALYATLILYSLALFWPINGVMFSEFVLRFSLVSAFGFVLTNILVIWHRIPLEGLDKYVLHGMPVLRLSFIFAFIEYMAAVNMNWNLTVVYTMIDVIVLSSWSYFAWKRYAAPCEDMSLVYLFHYWRRV